ncbi:HET domain containing protein [Hyaloscypha variabilis]
MLCSTCKAAINYTVAYDPDKLTGAYKSHHRIIEDLHNTAIENCHICTQLFRNWEQLYWDTFRPESTLSSDKTERAMVTDVMENQRRVLNGKNKLSWLWGATVDDYFSRYTITILNHQDKLVRELTFSATRDYFSRSNNTALSLQVGHQWFVVLPSQRVQQYTLPRAYTQNQRTTDTWRQNLAQGWLQDCIKGHPQYSPRHSGWRPTRLLQVSRSEPSTVKLILAKDEPVTEHQHPYPQLLDGVPISILPKTFQDALIMTRFLGFEYMWIDSLCIMQDSIDDWKTESAFMGDVYGNAVCNLAAAGSRDGNGGLWMDRSSLLHLPCEVESKIPLGSKSTWHIHPRSLKQATLLLNGPLLKRGWVIQERILAPRTLYFGTYQLFWECSHHQACETYPGGLPDMMQVAKSNLVTLENLEKAIGVENDDIKITSADVNRFWEQIILGFSRCDLTKPEDRLIAISGLARKIQERNPQFDFLMKGGGTKSYQRMTAFRAPSWSWASLDAGVMMMMSDSFFEKSIMPRILDVQIQEGDDPMGQNVSASLRIEGHLMTFGIRCGTESTDLGSAEFCINGVWHQPRMESEKLYALRDADEPFRNLHCLVLADSFEKW